MTEQQPEFIGTNRDGTLLFFDRDDNVFYYRHKNDTSNGYRFSTHIWAPQDCFDKHGLLETELIYGKAIADFMVDRYLDSIGDRYSSCVVK